MEELFKTEEKLFKYFHGTVMACLIRQEARVSTNSRLRCQIEASMSRQSQTKSAYVQTVTDGKCQCPDFRSFTRLSYFYVQIFVRSPDFRAFMSRLSCVHQTFVLLCPDFCAFTRLSCDHVQTFVRSSDFRTFMSRFLCVHQTFVRSCPDFLRSPDFHAIMSRRSCVHQTSCVLVQIFVRSPDFPAIMSRLSCVHQTFVLLCPDFCAFTRLSCVHVQTFVRSPDFVRSCPDFVRSPDFHAIMSRRSCVHQTSCVLVQIFVRSPDFPAIMFRLSCVQ